MVLAGGRSLSPRGASAAIAAYATALVALLIAPVPTWLLDGLLALNLGVALAVFIACLDGPPRVLRERLPRVLLLAAMARLALELAALRLALADGDSGAVIEAFGRAVLGHDWVVGSAVFIALSVVQLVVVVRGAERAAEVAARFDLDALPGRQLALDAEFRAGGQGPAGAALARAELARESRFHAAIDGAMRFVKGDAIAGVVMVGVNFGVGSALGVTRGGLTMGDSLERYGTLAVGQGMAAQVPSLLLAAGAALSVTRVVEETEGEGLTSALAIAAGVMAVTGILPGFPVVPFGVTAVVLMAVMAVESRSAELRVTVPEGERDEALKRVNETWREAGLPRVTVKCVVGEVVTVASRHGETVAVGSVGDLARALRTLAAREWTIDRAERALRRVGVEAPALHRECTVRGVQSVMLASVARALVEEGVAIGPWREVLEAWMRERGERRGGEEKLTVEGFLCGLRRVLVASWVREKFSTGLSVWELSPEVETLFDEAGDGGVRGEALREELGALGRSLGGASRPVVIATETLRRAVWTALSEELPEVVVLSPEELPEGVPLSLKGVVGPM